MTDVRYPPPPWPADLAQREAEWEECPDCHGRLTVSRTHRGSLIAHCPRCVGWFFPRRRSAPAPRGTPLWLNVLGLLGVGVIALAVVGLGYAAIGG